MALDDLTGEEESFPEPADTLAAPLAAEPSESPTTPDEDASDEASQANLVKEWWDRTSETFDFTAAVEQTVADQETLEGGTAAEVKDKNWITVNHVYRNATQTVAMTVPPLHAVNWKPEDQVKPISGFAIEPQMMAAYQKVRQERLGLAEVLRVLVRRFVREGHIYKKLKAAVQDSVHFRLAVVKTWWQRDLRFDPISEGRRDDAQDSLNVLRVLVEEYERGDFSESDAKYTQMKQMLESMKAQGEVSVHRGIRLESIPIEQYRCDPAVTGIEYLHEAEWERQDIMMRRRDVRAKFDHITDDDLDRCISYDVDQIGRAVRQQREQATVRAGQGLDPRSMTGGTSTSGRNRDEDWLLVAEIYDYVHNRRLVLVEGLKKAAQDVPLENMPWGSSPFSVIVLNRRPRKLYGFSDTELQAKIQRRINRKRTQEEDARENSQPRWAYDPAKINDPKAIIDITKIKPWTAVAVPVASGVLKDSMIPLVGNHEFNPLEYDTTKDDQELSKMAMLPEQALGVNGKANFSSEVQAGMAGGAALASERQGTITEWLGDIYHKFAWFTLANMPYELALQYGGPLAAAYYPKDLKQRRLLYDGLLVSVEVEMDQRMDFARKSDALTKLLDALAKMGVIVDATTAGKLLGKLLGMEEEAESLINPDPNQMVALLQQTLAENPQGLTPEAMATFLQLAQQVQQQAMQMVVEATASGGGAPGSGGAPSGGGMPDSLPNGGGQPAPQMPPALPQSAPAMPPAGLPTAV